MSSSLYGSREDMSHLKQMRGLEPIKVPDNVALEGPSHPKWTKPPEKIPVPSNQNANRANARTSNPYSKRTFDNLHDNRGPLSSLSHPVVPSGISNRSNPNSKTVVTSRHFNLGLLDKKEADWPESHHPAKRRKTESGSIVTSSSSNGSSFSNANGWKTGKTYISARRSPPPIIDLVDEEEDVGERISPRPPTALIGSPLTPTVSSDDIGLRSKPCRSTSPVSEFTDDPPRPISSKPQTQNGQATLSNTPHTQALMDRYGGEQIENADDFDNLSLKDDTRPRSRGKASSTPLGKTEIPKDLVKNNIENFEALKSMPASWDVNKAKKSNLIHNMKTKNSRELKISPVPKPPSKPGSLFSSTDFTNSKKGNELYYPLAEYILYGQLFKTTEDRPYSVRFSQEGISIHCNGQKDPPIVPLLPKSSFARILCPQTATDLVSEPVFIFWLGAEAESNVLNDDARFLGLKLGSSKSHETLRRIRDFVMGFGPREFAVKNTLSQLWTHLSTSGEFQPDGSVSNPSTLPGSSTRKAKPRPRPIPIPSNQRPTTRQASRSSLTTMKLPSNSVSSARRSLSPSSEELILVYPPSGTGALSITYGDLRRLEPAEFLNDTLIEFGLKLWLNDFRNREPELADQVHVFSSFFYTQLRQKNLEEGYQNVRKWTSRVDIFKKNYIIVPINEHLHWYLAIICYPGRILQWDAQPTSDSPVALIQSSGGEANHIAGGDRASTPPSDSNSNSTVREEKEVEIQTGANLNNDELTDAPNSISTRILSSTSNSRSHTPARSITRSASPPTPIDIVSDPPDPMDVDEPAVDITTAPTLSEAPYIFTFDSLGSRHPNVLKVLNSYLRMEAKDKKDLTVSIDAHTSQALVPTQPNSCDCGIYLLHFVEQFMSDPERFIKHILHKRQKKPWATVKSERGELWNEDEVAGKREALKQKVLLLSAEWKQSRKLDDKGKGRETDVQLSGPSRDRHEDSDIEVLEVTAAPSTSRPSKQRAQRLR